LAGILDNKTARSATVAGLRAIFHGMTEYITKPEIGYPCGFAGDAV
jgi:hypothetical protein